MLNPKEAFYKIGFPIVSEIVKKPTYSTLYPNHKDDAMYLVCTAGFKAGVNVADRDFCEKLQPEHRHN